MSLHDFEVSNEDRQYASELLADLANGGLPRIEIVARWFRKARLETLNQRELVALDEVQDDENANERAYERQCERYYGGEGVPVRYVTNRLKQGNSNENL